MELAHLHGAEVNGLYKSHAPITDDSPYDGAVPPDDVNAVKIVPVGLIPDILAVQDCSRHGILEEHDTKLPGEISRVNLQYRSLGISGSKGIYD